jgi:hypothetical protein
MANAHEAANKRRGMVFAGLQGRAREAPQLMSTFIFATPQAYCGCRAEHPRIAPKLAP